MSTAAAISQFFRANQKVFRFLFVFSLVFGALYLFFELTPGIRTGVIKPFVALLAKGVVGILTLFGTMAIADGNVVRSPDFSLSIVMGCDGVEATSLFVAGVIAFPTTWRARLIGLSFGIPLTQLINLARLVGLFYAGVYARSILEELHVYVAQTIVILLSTVILIWWLERVAIRYRRA